MMRKLFRPRITAAVFGALLISAVAGGVAVAGDGDGHRKEHDRARRALEAGEILPLRTLLDLAEERQPGRLLEVELDDDHGRITYEVKILTTDGRVMELDFDARTGELLEIEGGDE